jgi:hypothetical protein
MPVVHCWDGNLRAITFHSFTVFMGRFVSQLWIEKQKKKKKKEKVKCGGCLWVSLSRSRVRHETWSLYEKKNYQLSYYSYIKAGYWTFLSLIIGSLSQEINRSYSHPLIIAATHALFTQSLSLSLSLALKLKWIIINYFNFSFAWDCFKLHYQLSFLTLTDILHANPINKIHFCIKVMTVRSQNIFLARAIKRDIWNFLVRCDT